jgi:hypothetical protein
MTASAMIGTVLACLSLMANNVWVKSSSTAGSFSFAFSKAMMSLKEIN